MTDAKEPWKEWVPKVDDESWYSETNPEYGGKLPIAQEQTEAARRFVSQWLESDAHGFVIPGDEWGLSLKHWINHLVAATGPFTVHGEATHSAPTVKPVFRVDFTLDTVMWNEGFDQADYPWLRLYTDNAEWVAEQATIEHSTPVINSHFPQTFSVKTVEVAHAPEEADDEQREWETEDNEEYVDEMTYGQTPRFFGFLSGLTNEELDALVKSRLTLWQGI